ncbi:hypothetical protein GCM10017562_02320 [Streptomyces roseofulvus]|uniref:poly-gamma-glutamate hydrolase family protein n=1 Tax=Streptomyces roseofulvus TaxID=33902 RepID=UPI0031FA469D
MAAAATTLPLLNDLAGNGSTAAAAEATTTTTEFATNAALYSDPTYVEGTHWMRRFRTHPEALLQDNLRYGSQIPRSTAVIAPHGGGIELGTSELCLAIAGYKLLAEDEAALLDDEQRKEAGTVQRDYWMFEGLSSSGALHVTSTHCDDPAALAVCGRNLYAVSLHGFSPEPLSDESKISDKQIFIGGRDQRLMHNLAAAFHAFGLNTTSDPLRKVVVTIAAPGSPLNGDDPANIVNRTRTGGGAQLEISTALRKAMFSDHDGAPDRRRTAGDGVEPAHYWHNFVKAVREGIDRHERGLATKAPAA